jgi:uncharacterized glyoxalase superfamily protein PhnB
VGTGEAVGSAGGRHPGDLVRDHASVTCTGTVLESDDLEAGVDQLRVRGVTFEQGIQEAPWGRFVTFDDPDREQG